MVGSEWNELGVAFVVPFSYVDVLNAIFNAMMVMSLSNDGSQRDDVLCVETADPPDGRKTAQSCAKDRKEKRKKSGGEGGFILLASCNCTSSLSLFQSHQRHHCFHF